MNIIEALTHFESISLEAARRFFKKHKLEEAYYRVSENTAIGIGKNRLLAQYYYESGDENWEKVILFYDRCHRENEEKHYEDLMTLLVVGFCSAFLATIAAEAGKWSVSAIRQWLKGRQPTDKALHTHQKKISQGFFRSTRYVILGAALRELYREGKANEDDYQRQLSTLLKDLESDQDTNPAVYQQLTNDCEPYFVKHALNNNDPVNIIFEDTVSCVIEVINESDDKS